MSSPRPPFFDFLAELPRAGIAVDVTTHILVGRLLASYDGTSPDELLSALVALVAKNPATARALREQFARTFGPRTAGAQPVSVPAPPPIVPATTVPRRLWVFAAAAIVSAAIVAAAAAWAVGRHPAPQPAIRTDPPLAAGPEVIEAVEVGSCPGLGADIAAPPGRVQLGAMGGLVALSLALLGLVIARARATARAARRAPRFVRREEGVAPHELRPRAEQLEKDTLHDVATILGRLQQTVAPDRIDAGLSVERTVARAGFPHLVWQKQRKRAACLVLQDARAGGSLGAFATELTAGLVRVGVPVERRYLHHAPTRICERPHGGASLGLRSLALQLATMPLIACGDPDGFLGRWNAPVAQELQRDLRAWSLRVWLVPAATAPERSRALQLALGCRVFPATPTGLRAAAMSLAQRSLRPPDGMTAEDLDPRIAQRLQGLVSIAPVQSLEMAQALRLAFFPGTTDAILDAVQPLIDPTRGPMERRQDAREAGERLRAEDPALEQRARAFFLRELERVKPPEGTAAYRRWSLDRALQLLAMPDRIDEGTKELLELGHPGLTDDGRDSLLDGMPSAVAEALDAALRERVAPGTAAPASPFEARGRPLLLACAASVVIAVVGITMVRTARLGIEELPGAYTLAVSDERLIVRRVVTRAPAEVALLQAGRPPRPIHLDESGSASVEADEMSCVRVVGKFPGGIAYSTMTELRRSKRPPLIPTTTTVSLTVKLIDDATAARIVAPVTLESQDGSRHDLTSWSPLDVPAGDWTVQTSPPGYGAVSKTVSLSRKEEEVSFRLGRADGRLAISSVPPSVEPREVSIRDVPWSGARPIGLPEGPARVVLASRYYDPGAQVVQIRAGETTTLAVEAPTRNRYGVATLAVSPLSAAVVPTAPATVYRRYVRESEGRVIFLVRSTQAAAEVFVSANGYYGQGKGFPLTTLVTRTVAIELEPICRLSAVCLVDGAEVPAVLKLTAASERAIEVVTPVTEHELSCREYSWEATISGLKAERGRIKIVPGGTATLRCDVRLAVLRLDLKTPGLAPGDVTVDGVGWNGRPLGVQRGTTVEIAVRSSDFGAYSRRVVVNGDETVTVDPPVLRTVAVLADDATSISIAGDAGHADCNGESCTARLPKGRYTATGSWGKLQASKVLTLGDVDVVVHLHSPEASPVDAGPPESNAPKP